MPSNPKAPLSAQLHRFVTRRVMYPLNLAHKRILPGHLRDFCCRDLWSAEQLYDFQTRRLSEFLAYARRHCPYYRQSFARHGVNPDSPNPRAELLKLPPLTKNEVRENLESLFSDEFKGRSGLLKKATGGSTGQPLVVWGDFEDYRQNGLVIARQRRWVGWSGGMETLTIFGGFRDLPTAWRRHLKHWLINETNINNMQRENGDYARLAARIASSPPEALIAYFSSLRELAGALEQSHQRLRGIKVAIGCAEPLEERARRHAENWLGTRIYFQYGCRELGTFAQECQAQQGYHYAQDIALCEVLDDEGRPAQYGHLTITYFGNRVVPLIRYQIGDAAQLDSSPCQCGLPYLRLKTIDGRISAMIQTRSGERLTSMIFPHLFKDYSWLREYQVEQTACDQLVVRARTDPQEFSESSRIALDQKIRQLLGRDMNLEWRFNVPFLPVPTGKHVYFISRL